MSKRIGIAANLHVALFEDVEQADLHQLVELRQLVDREDAAVHPRDQAEVQRLLGRHAHAAGELGRVDLADDVGELGARREPLGIAVLALPPGDRDVVLGVVGDEPLAGRRDRLQRIFVDGDAGNVEIRHFVVEKPHERPHQAALALAFFAEEEHVVAGEQGEVDFGDDRAVVADDAGKQLVAAGQRGEEVVVDFAFDGFRLPAALAQLAESGRFGRRIGHAHARRPNEAVDECLIIRRRGAIVARLGLTLAREATSRRAMMTTVRRRLAAADRAEGLIDGEVDRVVVAADAAVADAESGRRRGDSS